MSVRKRARKYKDGQIKETWVADYVDSRGERHTRTFDRKKDADAYHATVRVDVSKGVHTSTKMVMEEAANDWLTFVQGEGREEATLAQYRAHVIHHIVPRIGREKLATLTKPRVEHLRDELVRDLTRVMAKKVLASLKAILKDAARRGNVAQNVALGTSVRIATRTEKELEIGVDIPAPAEIKAVLGTATGRRRAFLVTAIFTGMRASELRGLRWADVDFDKGEIRVRQRADRYGKIGPPKTASSRRDIPTGPFAMNTLREWKLACPKGPLELVFPTGAGHVERHSNLVTRLWGPAQVAAGVVGTDGKPKYQGLHALRHFYASWCISRKPGGRELPIKDVQKLMGHSSITVTADTYGHLFPKDDDAAELDKAERGLLG